MTTHINDLKKIKTTLAFKKCLSFFVKFTILILMLLNCANFYFAGLITYTIVRGVNSYFDYTIPLTVPDWFVFYVIILYLIVLVPLFLACSFLAEKLEDYKKYNITFDIERLKSQIETFKNEKFENEPIETDSDTNVILPANQIIEIPILPTKTKILEPDKIKPTSSIAKKSVENQRSDENNEKVPDTLSNSVLHSENELENFAENETKQAVSEEGGDEDTPMNVIESLNEIFVSNENIEDILEKSEFAETTSPLQKISAEDYIDRSKAKQDIGLKGEYFILKYEKGELIKNNKADLAIKVRHISKDKGDYAGYDILSYDIQGNEKYIEVKTSVKNYTADFFLTENEMNKIKRLDNYFIYRVFDFDTQAEKGNLYIVNCNKDFMDYFTIQPTQYKVSPRRK